MLKRRTILLLAICLVAIIIVSSLVIYANSVLNTEGSHVAWQRSIPNFATAIASDNDKVFTMDISGNVNCYDSQTGASIWNGSSVGGYFASGLIVAEGRIYGGYKHTSVGCLDEATGQFQWSTLSTIDHNEAPDAIVVENGRLFIVAEGAVSGISALNALTGSLLWQARAYYPSYGYGNITDPSDWWISGYPLGGNAFDGSFVYAMGGNSSSAYIFKLNTENGSIAWQAPLVRVQGIPNVVSIDQRQLIIENSDQILSLDPSSGNQLWRFDLDKTIYQPTVSESLVLLEGSDGYFYAVNATGGNLAWSTKVDSQNLMSTINGGNITLTTYPIQIEDGSLYWSFGVTHQLGTNSSDKHDTYTGTVCSLNLATGSVVWSRQMEDSGQLYDPPVGLVINKDTLYLTENTRLWVFNASNGALVKNQQFDHYILPPVMSDKKVIVASDLELTTYK